MPGPYLNSDTNSFAHSSVMKRWPAIIDCIVKDIHTRARESSEAQQHEVSDLIDKVEAIKTEMAEDAKLGFLPSNVYDADVYNTELDESLTWQSAPWLLSECFLYRKLHLIMENSQHWKKYDIFEHPKKDTFEKSSDAVSDLAERYLETSKSLVADHSSETLKALLYEFLLFSLWGNATDLSLLVTVSLEQLKKLQVGAGNRDKDDLLVNDFLKVWKQIQTQKGGRVDIVLDNSGFELFTDLVLTLFLLDTGLADQVVFHPKSQPWFVSDVVPQDFTTIFTLLEDTTKFPNNRDSVDALVKKLLAYLEDGQLVIRTSPFWTSPLPFWEIKENGKGGGDKVWRDLKQSKLVIFKGDLNYRKLTGDLMWDRSTPFRTAIRDLATSQIPLVTLRTIKADVCAGLSPGTSEELAAEWKRTHPESPGEGWAWSGQYAVISYHGGF